MPVSFLRLRYLRPRNNNSQKRQTSRASRLTTPNLIFTQIRFLLKINLIGGGWLSIKFQCYHINLVWLQYNLVIDFFFFYFRWKRSGFISDHEEYISCKNSNSPCFTQLTSQTRGLNSGKLDICKEEQASCEWTEYDDFPSSENLSAFPADMEMVL